MLHFYSIQKQYFLILVGDGYAGGSQVHRQELASHSGPFSLPLLLEGVLQVHEITYQD